MTASTMTMSRLGPSGSLRKKNIILEHAIAVIAKIINEAFFDVKFIRAYILRKENLLAYCTGLNFSSSLVIGEEYTI